MSGVSDGSLTAKMVALLQIKGMLFVWVISWFELFSCQVGLLIEAPQQLDLLLSLWGLSHLQRTKSILQGWENKQLKRVQIVQVTDAK